MPHNNHPRGRRQERRSKLPRETVAMHFCQVRYTVTALYSASWGHILATHANVSLFTDSITAGVPVISSAIKRKNTGLT